MPILEQKNEVDRLKQELGLAQMKAYYQNLELSDYLKFWGFFAARHNRQRGFWRGWLSTSVLSAHCSVSPSNWNFPDSARDDWSVIGDDWSVIGKDLYHAIEGYKVSGQSGQQSSTTACEEATSTK